MEASAEDVIGVDGARRDAATEKGGATPFRRENDRGHVLRLDF